MYSYLVFSQDRNDTNEDGLLETREVLNLDLNADLVVLSACETGRGKLGAGEGIVGMSWALFVAGSPATVVSQWKVESASTTELMLGFHRNLKSSTHMTKATALQQSLLLRLQTKLSVVMVSRFLWHVLSLPMNFFTQRHAGDIATRVSTNDEIARLLSGGVATNALSLISLIFFAAAMAT